MIKNAVIFLQIVVAILMTGSILMQSKGVGLGRAWGGGGGFYKSRRGVEKIVFYFTIICVALFLILSLISLLLA
ncbi:MAG: Preprotein translocase, SecG subunit [Candidatus Gottesmanbacteria bacterium GW2011_GWC2_39_8]|uniref:Protein-export membrane protein SecG n=1 Tax=Candidatus Gottesmanbacteria bacterium GW2011_GWC2_39_8 TaxID=1618450 RepID=A0A0G0PVC5_9BACT|nr:MAG: Preprotein translocase, SecG subunit [Candidatus Gottesmanbacteria bacterium GW2011_GWC2_39_8]